MTDADVMQIGAFMEQAKGKNYHMSGYNCTSFAIEVVRAAGFTPPPASCHSFALPVLG